IEVSGAGVTIDADASVSLGVLGGFEIAGHLQLMAGSTPGVVGSLAAAASLNFSQFVGLRGSASLQVLINTTTTAQTGRGFTVSPKTAPVPPDTALVIQPGFLADAGGSLTLGDLAINGHFTYTVIPNNASIHFDTSLAALGLTFALVGSGTVSGSRLDLDVTLQAAAFTVA